MIFFFFLDGRHKVQLVEYLSVMHMVVGSLPNTAETVYGEWHTDVILAFGWWWQEGHKFKVVIGHIANVWPTYNMRACLRKKS